MRPGTLVLPHQLRLPLASQGQLPVRLAIPGALLHGYLPKATLLLQLLLPPSLQQAYDR